MHFLKKVKKRSKKVKKHEKRTKNSTFWWKRWKKQAVRNQKVKLTK